MAEFAFFCLYILARFLDWARDWVQAALEVVT